MKSFRLKGEEDDSRVEFMLHTLEEEWRERGERHGSPQCAGEGTGGLVSKSHLSEDTKSSRDLWHAHQLGRCQSFPLLAEAAEGGQKAEGGVL